MLDRTTVDRETFDQLVREALSHLYDHAFLQAHPLAALLVHRPGGEGAGQTLHRVLLGAIEDLRPSPHLPRQSLAGRKYRYAVLRYISAQPVVQIAEEMGISLRHSSRTHREVLDALASILWRRYLEAQDAVSGARAAIAEPPKGPDAVSNGFSVEAEADRISSAASEDLTTLEEAMASALSTLSPLAVNRAIDLSVDVSPDLPPVVVERTAVRQALLGLLLAAVDWARQGSVRVEAVVSGAQVEVRILSATKDGAQVVDERQDGDLWSGRLSLSERLIEARGGTVGVEADAGRLTICVRLPQGQPITVMVVDDNPALLDLFERYLRGSIYHMVGVHSAEEAVRVAHQVHPRVVTLDVMMPSRDGWETLQLLKNHRDTRDVPIIVCSVLRERDLALALGAADFLPKPATQRELLAALERCRLSLGGRPG